MKYRFNIRQEIRSTKFFYCLLVITSLMLMSSPLTSQEVFATHLSEELKWQLLFISNKGCGLSNHEKMNQFNQITEKYLELYGLETSKYDPLCLKESEYLSKFNPPNDLDLIILAYDKNLGEKVLHSQKMGGLYSHTGNDRNYNHVIMVCDCSNFYYSDPVWILSHELSHFVMYYRNYDMSVIEDLIHSNDDEYDKCIDRNINCESYVTKLGIEATTKLFSVMPIFKPESILKTETENTDEKVRTSVIGISKIITKWWSSGKITDGDYANAIGYLIDSDILPSDGNSEILIADEPIDDAITWEEKFSEINSNLRGSGKTEVLDQNNNSILNLESTINRNNNLYVEEVILGLPQWFKTTAGWWAQDKITDEEFKKNIQFLVRNGIVRPHTSNIMQEVINEKETLLDSSLQKLIEDIKILMDSETLNDEDGKRLLNNINSAIIKFDFANSAGGCNKLEEFIEDSSILVDHDILEYNQGQSLIDSADIIKLNFCN